MNLLTALGATTPPTLAPEQAQELTGRAVRFLRAGGVVSLTEWREMSGDECAILVKAGAQLEAERAARLVIALSGPLGLARVMSESDDGAAEAQILCDVAAKVAADRLEGSEVRA